MSSPDSLLGWIVKSAQDPTTFFGLTRCSNGSTISNRLRAKLEKDLEFGDTFSTSELSTLDVGQLLVIVERQIVHLVASVERLIGPAPRA